MGGEGAPTTRIRAGILLGTVVAAATAALWPSASSLLENWREIYDYQHGYLVAAVSVAWLVLVGKQLGSGATRFSGTGCLLLTGALLTWLVAYRANSDILLQLLFPPAIWLSVLATMGWPIARQTIAPIAYLYFAVPVWEILVPTLQLLSVLATETTLALAGVPADVREYTVTIPAGTFQIIEGCSGKRYFVVTLAVAVIAGELQRLQGWRLAALILAGGGLALVANWLRIFVVIYAGHVTDMQHYLVANEHKSFGNVVFVVLLIAVYVLSRRLAHTASEGGRIDSGDARTAAGATHALWSRALIGLPFVLLAATLVLTHAPRAMSTVAEAKLGGLPLATGDWEGPLPARPAWAPRYVRPASERRAAYLSRAEGTVQVYVNMYAEQFPGRELVYYDNTLLAPGAWTRNWPLSTKSIVPANGPPLVALEARTQSGDLWQLAYVYKVGGWTTGSGPLAQAGYGLRSILRPAPSGIVALAVQCKKNCQEAQALVRAFWDDMSGPILGMIADNEP